MKVAVIGAGSWGTALSQVAARNGNEVCLWARRDSIASAINETHHNPDYLSQIELLPSISATSDLVTAVDGAQAVIVVTPSKTMHQTAQMLAEVGLGSSSSSPERDRRESSLPILICTKGIDYESGEGPVAVFVDELGNASRFACLSGPNHAEEVVLDKPAATVIASSSAQTAALFQTILGSSTFRVYTSDDVIGVELCGAAKNVMAIAVGVSYGLGYGDNTAAMIMTRGQAEMSRLIESSGGSSQTCMGLAGTGDLIATCMSRFSRNRSFGEALAAGESLEEYEARRHMIVEGAQACRALSRLSKELGVDVPLIDAVNDVIWGDVNPEDAATTLEMRSLKPEFY